MAFLLMSIVLLPQVGGSMVKVYRGGSPIKRTVCVIWCWEVTIHSLSASLTHFFTTREIHNH